MDCNLPCHQLINVCVSGRIDLAGENIPESSWGPAPQPDAPSLCFCHGHHCLLGVEKRIIHCEQLGQPRIGCYFSIFPFLPPQQCRASSHCGNWVPSPSLICHSDLSEGGKLQALQAPLYKPRVVTPKQCPALSGV